MQPLIILAVIAGVPLLLVILFRVSAIFFFLSVAAGALFTQYIADDTSLVFNSFFNHMSVDVYVKLVLLLFPVLMTILFLRKTLSGSQFIFHIIPTLATSLALTTLVVSNLPGGIRYEIMNNSVGNIVSNSQNVAVTAAGVLALLLAWFTMRPSKSKHR